MKNCCLRLLAALAAAVGAAEAVKSPEAPANSQQVAPRLEMSAPFALPGERYQRGPAIAYGKGIWLLAWQQGYHGAGGRSAILAMRIGSDGKPLDKLPVAVCSDEGARESSAVAFSGNRFLVAWADFRNGHDYDIRAAFVGLDGEVEPPGGFALAGGPGGQASPALAWNGADQILAAWMDHRSGKGFDIYGARISAASGELMDKESFLVLSERRSPAVAWAGAGWLVTMGPFGAIVGPDGKVGPRIQLWSGQNKISPAAAVSAWGKAYSFYNTASHPDPWGWGGNGAIVGVSVTSDGTTPEYGATKHGWYDLARNQADRIVRNIVDAARWKNHNGWPMGMKGGFKGSHDGTWPSGQPAAALTGHSLLVVWPRSNFVDVLRLANRDLYLKRVLPDWAYVDEPAVRIVVGPTEETGAALASDGAGRTILAYNRQIPDGGLVVEYRILTESPDREGPRLAWLTRETGTRIRIGFDEPVDAQSAGDAANYAIDGLAVKAAEFDASGAALKREVVLTTDEHVPHRNYALRVRNVKDLSPQANGAGGEPYEYRLPAVGRGYRSDFVECWLLVGPFPNDWSVDWLDPRTVRPAAGAVVKNRTDEEKKAVLRRKLGDEKWAKGDYDVVFQKSFSGDKTWNLAECQAGSLLRLSGQYGELQEACAYVHTYIYSPKNRAALLRIDSNDGNQAWVNGELVISDPAKPSRGLHDYTTEAQVTLNAGWNRLLIQVENRFGLWLMVAQITDLERQPIRELIWHADGPPAE